MQILRYTGVTSTWQSDPRRSPACHHQVLWSKYSITGKYRSHASAQQPQEELLLQLLTEHQPCAAEVHTSIFTNTHTYKSQKWGLVSPRPGKDTRGHRNQRPWSNASWVSIFDWGLPPIVWCNHSDRYHFTMRFLTLVKVWWVKQDY